MADDLDKLVELLNGNDHAQSLEAAEELALLGPYAQVVAVEMVTAMATENEEIREQVTAALEEMGPPMVEQLPELATLLEDPCADVAYWAATLLGRLGKLGKDAVPSLIEVADNSSADLAVRQRSVWALGKIGRPAVAAIPVLEKLAKTSNNAKLSRLVSAAIEQISP